MKLNNIFMQQKINKKINLIGLIFLVSILTISGLGLTNSIQTEAINSTKNTTFEVATIAINNAKTKQSVLIKTKANNSLSNTDKEIIFNKIAKIARITIDFYLTNFDSFVALVDADQLAIIKRMPEVTEVRLYKQYQLPEKPKDNSSVGSNNIQAIFNANSIPAYHQALGILDNNSRDNLTGVNTNIAIIDTGVDFNYPELAGKSVAEACFSDINKEPNIKSYSLCPNGQTNMTGIGSAKPCQGLSGCEHGSHVSGIATGKKTDNNHQGIAPDAKIVAINVFHVVENEEKCTPKSRFSDFVNKVQKCIFTSNFAYLKALDFVLEQNKKTPITSVNMSLGTNDTRNDNCDDEDTPSFHKIIDSGIALIIAAGNGSNKSRMSHPACQSRVLSVAAYDVGFASDTFFSNISPKTTYFAPGYQIRSIGMNMSGTSMSTPMVAGVTALLKQANNNLNAQSLQNILTSTGTKVGSYNAKLVNIPQAIKSAKSTNTIPRNNPTPTPSPFPNPTPRPTPNPTPLPELTGNCKKGIIGWCATFFDNKTLSGSSVTRTLNTLDTRGQTIEPALGISEDNFSAIFTTNFKITNTKPANYKFKYNFDDGVRVYLKSANAREVIIDEWYNKAPRNKEIIKSLPAGDYQITVEYYEKEGGATYSLVLFDPTNKVVNFNF